MRIIQKEEKENLKSSKKKKKMKKTYQKYIFKKKNQEKNVFTLSTGLQKVFAKRTKPTKTGIGVVP